MFLSLLVNLLTGDHFTFLTHFHQHHTKPIGSESLILLNDLFKANPFDPVLQIALNNLIQKFNSENTSFFNAILTAISHVDPNKGSILEQILPSVAQFGVSQLFASMAVALGLSMTIGAIVGFFVYVGLSELVEAKKSFEVLQLLSLAATLDKKLFANINYSDYSELSQLRAYLTFYYYRRLADILGGGPWYRDLVGGLSPNAEFERNVVEYLGTMREYHYFEFEKILKKYGLQNNLIATTPPQPCTESDSAKSGVAQAKFRRLDYSDITTTADRPVSDKQSIENFLTRVKEFPDHVYQNIIYQAPEALNLLNTWFEIKPDLDSQIVESEAGKEVYLELSSENAKDDKGNPIWYAFRFGSKSEDILKTSSGNIVYTKLIESVGGRKQTVSKKWLKTQDLTKMNYRFKYQVPEGTNYSWHYIVPGADGQNDKLYPGTGCVGDKSSEIALKDFNFATGVGNFNSNLPPLVLSQPNSPFSLEITPPNPKVGDDILIKVKGASGTRYQYWIDDGSGVNMIDAVKYEQDKGIKTQIKSNKGSDSSDSIGLAVRVYQDGEKFEDGTGIPIPGVVDVIQAIGGELRVSRRDVSVGESVTVSYVGGPSLTDASYEFFFEDTLELKKGNSLSTTHTYNKAGNHEIGLRVHYIDPFTGLKTQEKVSSVYVNVEERLPLPEGSSDVPLFGQRDSAWSSQRLGTCGNTTITTKKGPKSIPTTIGGFGCAITSAAMVFKYYGIDTDPGRLNTKLTNIGGYVRSCNLGWANLKKASGGILTDYEFSDKEKVSEYIHKGIPVIARLEGYLSGFPTHFVVIVNETVSTYIVNDPWYGQRGIAIKKTLSTGFHVLLK